VPLAWTLTAGNRNDVTQLLELLDRVPPVRGRIGRPRRRPRTGGSNAHGGTGNGTVSAFSVAGDGALSTIGTSPFHDFQTAPCWIEISHDGH